MKKPRRLYSIADFFEKAALKVPLGSKVVTISERDFEKLWALAKEVIHKATLVK